MDDEQIYDGGPAFAHSGDYYSKSNEQTGMSLRDWFAGQALAGLLAGGGHATPDDDAENAYKLADAMLAARLGEDR